MAGHCLFGRHVKSVWWSICCCSNGSSGVTGASRRRCFDYRFAAFGSGARDVPSEVVTSNMDRWFSLALIIMAVMGIMSSAVAIKCITTKCSGPNDWSVCRCSVCLLYKKTVVGSSSRDY